MTDESAERMLTPGEAGKLFGVHSGTIRRWAEAGMIACTKTAQGHRRYREADVRALLEQGKS